MRLSLTLLYISELIFICRFNGPFRTFCICMVTKDYMAILFPFAVASIPYVLLNTILPSIGGAPIHLYDPKQPLQGMSPYVLMIQCAFFLFVSLLMYIQGVKRDRKNIEEDCKKRSVQKIVSSNFRLNR